MPVCRAGAVICWGRVIVLYGKYVSYESLCSVYVVTAGSCMVVFKYLGCCTRCPTRRISITYALVLWRGLRCYILL